jgi:hypothetical protein
MTIDARSSLWAAAVLAVAATGFGCSQEAAAAVYPAADMRPPDLLDAGPEGPTSFALRFDEAVTPVAGSLAARPEASLSGRAEGELLLVAFAEPQAPGADYALTGEVEDARGNRTRFLVRFAGWNDRAPRLRLSEAQTGKNDSKTRPHRDFVEIEALGDGNIWGEELEWTSSVKSATYRFAPAEVRRGEFIVLHLAPQGLPEEKDELGDGLSASGGVDATPGGRDLWCPALPLPDSSCVLQLRLRPGEAPIDGLFYADGAKGGPLPEGRLAAAMAALREAGAWPVAGAVPAWEDAVPWKGSSGKSLCRSASGTARGKADWYACASGAQSPGAANAGPEAAKAAKASSKVAGKSSVKNTGEIAAATEGQPKRATKDDGDRPKKKRATKKAPLGR